MTSNKLEITIGHAPFECYVLDKIGLPIISPLSIRNIADEDVFDMRIDITSDLETVEKHSIEIERLAAGDEIRIEPELRLSDARLVQATERYEETVRVRIANPAETFLDESFDIDIWPFDQWPGSLAFDSIACFVTPNHPAIAPVMLKASEILGSWTGNPALDGYQSGDPDRVRKMAGAVYLAIKEQGIVYSEPPSSFGAGQRIRFAGDVLTQHMGTCIDLAVLYASCLENIGLNPFLVIVEGHAFAGAWLDDSTFPETIIEDPSQLVNRFSKGIDELFVVECTLLCNHARTSFDEACIVGQKNMVLEGDFLACVDIVRAHRGGLTPMPLRVKGDSGWEIEAPKPTATLNLAAPGTRAVSTAFIDETTEGRFTKKDLWERGLLDLSLRNNLLNMRFGGRLIPLATPNLDDLEDALADGTALAIAAKPAEWGRMDLAFELIAAIGQYEDFLRSEFKSKRIRTFSTPAELTKSLTSLYRASRLSLEETGANTLYVALGALRWIRPGDKAPHYAPIVLIPVEIVRKSAKKGFSLVIRDEDPQLNISLTEMLRRDFGIDIGGLDPLPMDERGIDTRLIFNTFKRKIMDQTQWEVLEIGCLGTFSFSQFVMWDDIHSHETELRRSKIVSSLLDGRLTWDAEPMVMPKRVDRDDALIAVKADASQLFAIKEAAADKSFVLHGPPGTGKSQVITGIIANALAHDKRVLFVSEKAAALNVVERRLDALGIGKFCLELHSNKANKSHVLDQLQQASEMYGTAQKTNYAEQLAAVRSLKERLDAYADALYETNEAQLTLREQICRYQELKDAEGPDLPISTEYIANLASLADLEGDVRLVELLAAATSELGSPGSHPLKMILGSEYSHEARFKLEPACAELENAVKQSVNAAAIFCAKVNVVAPRLAHEWRQLDQLAEEALAAPRLPGAWTTHNDLASLLSEIEFVMNEKAQMDAFVSRYGSTWSSGFFSLDPNAIEQEWSEARSAGLFKRKRAVGEVVRKVSTYSTVPLTEEGMPQAIALLRNYAAMAVSYRSHLANVSPYLVDMKHFDDYNWTEVRTAVTQARSAMSALSPVAKMISKALAADPEAEAACQTYRVARATCIAAEEGVRELTGDIDLQDDSWAEGTIRACNALSAHGDKLQEWMRWRKLARKLEARKLACVVDTLMIDADPALIVNGFKSSLYRTMCALSLSKHHEVASFSAAVFEEQIRQYALADEKLLELSKQELQLHLAAKVPNLTLVARKGSEAAVFKRAVRSKGRGVSIRSLLSQIPELLSQLAPCMLMSPLSVAQYLDFANEPFDLVVFDEASQLQTCKAVGSLARAKNAIIVGDPKQMPPTSFFQSQTSDEEFTDISDLESVLEDCLAINMPETYLQWHYRSRHESLISFSNAQFYGSNLCTFPSADDSVSRVRLINVPGHYEGDGMNSFEARAVVEELLRRYRTANGNPPSIGVITFNVKQQNLIEDLLEEEYGKNPAFESWALSGVEPLFVKNLENVQGDERDVILFSITYAPDENGKMAMRFGPVNAEGGWRRLNVAVTRSRCEMTVFATLKPEQIDLNRTPSKGVRALKNFLEFAKHGKFIGTGAVARKADDFLAGEVRQVIENAGYHAVRNVGNSAYKVDIAVASEDGIGYLAGVLLDGESYGSARSTHDREVAREDILKGLGWSIFRVWAIDWWANAPKVTSKLLAFLAEAQKHAAEQATTRRTEQADREAAPNESAETHDGMSIPIKTSERSHAGKASTAPTGEREPSEERQVGDSARSNVGMMIKADANIMVGDAAADHGVAHPSETPKAQDDDVESDSVRNVENPLRVEEYRPTELPNGPVLSSDEYQSDHDEEILARFRTLIENEAPIEKTRLCNRVRESFGIARSGKLIQARNDEMLARVEHFVTQRGSETFIWRRGDDPRNYKTCRIPAEGVETLACHELCDQELVALFLLILEDRETLTEDDLIRAAATRYGYKRVASKMHGVMSAAIAEGIRNGMLTKEGDTIRAL